MDYSTTTIIGTLLRIKDEREGAKGQSIMFIIQRKGAQDKPTHQYIITAYSKPGQQDRFGIYDLIGHEVEAECYVNGRIRETPKGDFHITDLNLKTIRTV